MTAYSHCELRCDRAGCRARYDIGDARADATRASAARVPGWVHGVGIRFSGGPMCQLDFCREHAGDLAPSPITHHEARVLRAIQTDRRIALAREDAAVATELVELGILERDGAGGLMPTDPIGILLCSRLDPLAESPLAAVGPPS